MSNLITVRETAEMLRIHYKSVYRLLGHPKMPKPVRVSPRKQMFRRGDIEAFLENGGFEPSK